MFQSNVGIGINPNSDSYCGRASMRELPFVRGEREKRGFPFVRGEREKRAILLREKREIATNRGNR